MATLIPAITYGGGTAVYLNVNCDSNAATTTGGSYRIAQWSSTGNSITSASNTYPTTWDQGTNTTGIIEFRTLNVPWVQYTQGPTLNLNQYQYYRYGDDTWAYTYSVPTTVQKTPQERLREILDSRMAPGILSSCKPLGYTKDIRELRARETLRRVLGEDKFRDFVRRGHVSVRAKSGLVYQMFPGHDFTKVYENGKMIDRLCVVLNGDFPPTDSLIMRYLMILNNEQQFRSYAIKHGATKPYLPAQPDQRSLVEIFKELKKVA